MPLVRIDVIEGRTDDEIRCLADTVQAVMAEHFAAPERDRYQVIHEHRPGRIIALYAGLAQRLEADCGIASTDLVVSVVENTPADWSFGLGRAQFLDGDL